LQVIDSTEEALLSLAQAAAELPKRRAGRKLHLSTMYRWATAGCRGIVLETIQVGSTRCTSRQALQRFFESLTAKNRHGFATPSAAPVHRSPAKRLRASEKAGKALEKTGA
jgi:hypothetical protein